MAEPAGKSPAAPEREGQNATPSGATPNSADKAASPASNASANTSGVTSPASGETPSTPSGDKKTSNGSSFNKNFKAFSKFGDTKSDGKNITLSQSDKWMKQAGVIDGKKITTTDTGIFFKKFKSLKIGIDDYNKFMEDLAKSKKTEVSDLKTKMGGCGSPGIHGTNVSKVAGAVDRLTDVSKYTGSHKQRFDETGKGRGIAGRKDVAEASGYVQGYQNKDTYSKTH